ncbi:unnamed protein product [marine sediment metagenome]|uniref:Uncharacterized protein n=1 Tax=marine sediment metagenome TaxID=412755 RepID=X1AV79_9ZZZZ
MKRTRILDKDWLDWNVGNGKRFNNLEELLSELRRIRDSLGPSYGFAGGNITEEIELIKSEIEQKKNK